MKEWLKSLPLNGPGGRCSGWEETNKRSGIGNREFGNWEEQDQEPQKRKTRGRAEGGNQKNTHTYIPRVVAGPAPSIEWRLTYLAHPQAQTHSLRICCRRPISGNEIDETARQDSPAKLNVDDEICHCNFKCMRSPPRNQVD